MNSDDAVSIVIRALDDLGIPYMLTGSLASNYYGVSRATKDADFLLQTPNFSISRLQDALGTSFRLDSQMTFETVTMTTRHVIEKVAGEPFKIELFFLSTDPHDVSRFNRRKPGLYLGQRAWIASAEDVIITKLRWSKEGKRTKDVDDVRNVIAVQRDALDWNYIYKWCDEHGTRAILDEIRTDLPDVDD